MKLDCKVRINDRQRVHGSTTLKAAKGVVGLAKSNGDQWVLIVRLFKDVHPTQYKLKENVLNLLHKCIANGMATIQIHNPPHDIQLSEAQVDSLKMLLSGVRLASTGKDLPANIKSTSVNVVQKLQRPVVQLIISKANEYPTLKGFPSTLEKLMINTAQLRAPVDRRIFALKHLHTLDLSTNNITELPSKIDMHQLHTLIIRANQLRSLPTDFNCPNLKSLDLSENQIEKIDTTILNLKNLDRLILSSNKIRIIPRTISRAIPMLKIFNVTANQIRFVPNSLTKAGTNLQSFDYGDNPFLTEKSVTCRRFDMSLVEFGLRAVIKHRLSYNPTTLPRTLCEILDEYELCANCASPCLLNYAEIMVPRHLSIHGVTIHFTAASQSLLVPIQERYCSWKCFNYGLKRAGMI